MGIAFMDFMSWYAMEFAAGRKSHADELNWLIREGVIRARRGYQSKIALYQQFTNTLAELGLTDASLKDILNHPAFTTEEAPAANTEGYPGEQLSLVA